MSTTDKMSDSVPHEIPSSEEETAPLGTLDLLDRRALERTLVQLKRSRGESPMLASAIAALTNEQLRDLIRQLHKLPRVHDGRVER